MSSGAMTMEAATPASEAIRIIQRLDEQMESLNPALGALPSKFFSDLLAAGEDKAHETDLRRALLSEAKLAGRAEYLGNVLQACVHCAAACRLQGDSAWSAVLRAQQYAGVALAILVAGEEVGHGRSKIGKAGRTKRTDANAKLKAHVLGLIAGLPPTIKTVSKAAAETLEQLEEKHGDLQKALAAHGSTLSADRLEKTIEEYVREDMERLGLRTPGDSVSQTENRAKFSDWKKLYASQAGG